MLLRRLLLSNEIEVYQIKQSLYGDIEYYMIFVDMKRPSCLEDYPFISEEDFQSRSNFIKAIILYDKTISEDDKELTYEIVSGFLEDKDDCDWSLLYQQENFEKLRVIGTNSNELIMKINEVLLSCKIKKSIQLNNKDSFKYLCQF